MEDSRKRGVRLLNDDHDRAGFDLISRLNIDGFYGAVDGARNRLLHFHSFQSSENGTGFYRVAYLYIDRQNRSRNTSFDFRNDSSFK